MFVSDFVATLLLVSSFTCFVFILYVLLFVCLFLVFLYVSFCLFATNLFIYLCMICISMYLFILSFAYLFIYPLSISYLFIYIYIYHLTIIFNYFINLSFPISFVVCIHPSLIYFLTHLPELFSVETAHENERKIESMSLSQVVGHLAQTAQIVAKWAGQLSPPPRRCGHEQTNKCDFVCFVLAVPREQVALEMDDRPVGCML